MCTLTYLIVDYVKFVNVKSVQIVKSDKFDKSVNL